MKIIKENNNLIIENIKSNNENGILPEIDGIEKIECLNCGTMKNAQANTSEFDIQLQITYRDSNNKNKDSHTFRQNIVYNEESPYTSQLIINAISSALSKGKVD